MIDSLLEDLPPNGLPREREGNVTSESKHEPSESAFLAALAIVRRIVARRRSSLDPTNGLDVVQDVALRIWRWRLKHPDRSRKMSVEDLNAFAARTAYNELNRDLARTRRPAHLPLEASSENEEPYVPGESDLESVSLIHQAWQEICKLSLRQRRSLLLHSHELVIYILQIGISEAQLACVLDFNESDWSVIREHLPMSDLQIAERIEASVGSIKKARYEARGKLEGVIGR